MGTKADFRYSKYINRNVCSECDWFSLDFYTQIANVCPECGASTGLTVGRFVYEDRPRWFGLWKEQVVVGFKKRRDEKKERQEFLV